MGRAAVCITWRAFVLAAALILGGLAQKATLGGSATCSCSGSKSNSRSVTFWGKKQDVYIGGFYARFPCPAVLQQQLHCLKHRRRDQNDYSPAALLGLLPATSLQNSKLHCEMCHCKGFFPNCHKVLFWGAGSRGSLKKKETPDQRIKGRAPTNSQGHGTAPMEHSLLS